MTDPSGRERIGRVLQALAADLATEQRRVMRLRRENRELRAELAALQQRYERATGSTDSDEKLEALKDPTQARRSTRRSG
jgi:cell shape-determining protein MreC